MTRCALCENTAIQKCPRCGQGRCAEHALFADQRCESCERAYTKARVAISRLWFIIPFVLTLIPVILQLPDWLAQEGSYGKSLHIAFDGSIAYILIGIIFGYTVLGVRHFFHRYRFLRERK